jgi:hypothetical protein
MKPLATVKERLQSVRPSSAVVLLTTEMNRTEQSRADQSRTDDTRTEHVGFEVFTAVTMEKGVFWDVTPCGSCMNRRFVVI